MDKQDIESAISVGKFRAIVKHEKWLESFGKPVGVEQIRMAFSRMTPEALEMWRSTAPEEFDAVVEEFGIGGDGYGKR